MQVRRATADDSAAVAALHVTSWRDTYAGIMPREFLDGPVEEDRARVWRHRLRGEQNDWVVLLAVDDGELVGFVALAPDADEGVLLDNLHVEAGRRGRGVGRTLLHLARDTAAERWPGHELYLWVLSDNVRAARFYEREGGIAAGTRQEVFPAGFTLAETRYRWPAVVDVAG